MTAGGHGPLQRWPLLLVAAVFVITAALRLATAGTDDNNDPWAGGAWSVGVLLLGVWTGLEVQRLSGQRRMQDPWPGGGHDDG